MVKVDHAGTHLSTFSNISSFPFPSQTEVKLTIYAMLHHAAVERGWNNLNGVNDFRTENDSSQGQNLGFTRPTCAEFSRQRNGHLLHINVQWFRGGLVFKADRLLYHSTLGLRVIKKKNRPGRTRRREGTARARTLAWGARLPARVS